MTIDLTAYERGAPFEGDYHAELKALQVRLGELQLRQIIHRQRLMVLFEGWVGSGKGKALQRYVAGLDPCHYAVHCIGRRDPMHAERHWLAPFWEKLPRGGSTAVFFRSWYRQMVAAYLGGRADARQWSRMHDEVNEFENQQREHGTVIVKLFFHVPADVQAERLRAEMADPWRKHLLHPSDFDGVERRGEVFDALSQLFGQTDTRWAPWTIIDAADKRSARIATLRTVVAAMEKMVPAEPPADRPEGSVVAFPSAVR